MGQFASILCTSRNFSSNISYRLEDCLHYFASNSRQVMLELGHAALNQLIESHCELDEALETLFLNN